MPDVSFLLEGCFILTASAQMQNIDTTFATKFHHQIECTKKPLLVEFRVRVSSRNRDFKSLC